MALELNHNRPKSEQNRCNSTTNLAYAQNLEKKPKVFCFLSCCSQKVQSERKILHTIYNNEYIRHTKKNYGHQFNDSNKSYDNTGNCHTGKAIRLNYYISFVFFLSRLIFYVCLCFCTCFYFQYIFFVIWCVSKGGKNVSRYRAHVTVACNSMILMDNGTGNECKRKRPVLNERRDTVRVCIPKQPK